MEKKFVGIEELSSYLGIVKGTLYGWVYLRKIPYIKIGRLVKFDLQEIEQWLKSRKVKEMN
jgi:excisionase family DNA binding protein